jgi:GNAT superfamily N-acetyltransferase
MRDMEVWLARREKHLAGALILEPREGDLLIWSIASDPAVQGGGLGRALLAAAEERARRLGRVVVRLYTGGLTHPSAGMAGTAIGWSASRPERRSITHMIKLDGLGDAT